jgi:hypothetical protein
MLAKNIDGVNAAQNTEVTICEWISDELQLLIGFTATGTEGAQYKLYIVELDSDGHDLVVDPWYTFITTTSSPTAYIADRAKKITAGRIVRLTVKHSVASVQNFYGTILGGGY